MPAIGQIVIEGLAELRSELRAAQDASPREVTRQLKVGADKVTALAKQLAPKRTGAMADDLKAFATARAAGVKGTLAYTPVEEFKQSLPGAPPRFAFRAVAQLGPQLVDDAFNGLVEILKCHGWFKET